MKHAALLLLILCCTFPSLIYCQNAYHIYFNEVRPDDSGADDLQFVELIGPAGINITGFKIIHYNGDETQDGGIWSHTIGSFTIPDDGVTDASGTALGFYVFGNPAVQNVDETTTANIQNGPDGMVLYDASSNIIDAIAWEGPGDLPTNDPGTVTTTGSPLANNYLHVTADDDNTDNSLSAPDYVVGDDGNGWLIIAATPGAINNNQSSGSIVLPIELIYFKSQINEEQVSLQWATAFEESNSYFSIERATYSFDFHELARVEGQGTTYETHRYTFADYTPVPGINYYRLKQVDFNGNYTYSPVVEAWWEKGENFRLYPSPAASRLHIVLPESWQDEEDIILFNLLGQVQKFWHFEVPPHEATLDLSDLASGPYFLEILSGHHLVVQKFEKR